MAFVPLPARVQRRITRPALVLRTPPAESWGTTRREGGLEDRVRRQPGPAAGVRDPYLDHVSSEAVELCGTPAPSIRVCDAVAGVGPDMLISRWSRAVMDNLDRLIRASSSSSRRGSRSLSDSDSCGRWLAGSELVHEGCTLPMGLRSDVYPSRPFRIVPVIGYDDAAWRSPAGTGPW